MRPYRILPQLTLRDLSTSSLLETLIDNTQEDYYWSDDFSAEFYAAQARAGFMAVTEVIRGEELLLPELQRSYAVLDFEDLHISRHVRRILERDRPRLRIGLCLHGVGARIQAHHKHAWLTPRYLQTLDAVNARTSDLHVIAVALEYAGEMTAGEIGYILGRTYTSHSGFSSRDRRHRNHGTAQLVLLGQWLHRHGFAFWNLGQPYMPYKFALGAREYSRREFLGRWQAAVRQPLPIHHPQPRIPK